MTRFSFWAVAAFAMITNTSALACPGGMGMGGGQRGGHGMHAMMPGPGPGRGLNQGQMMGQGCGQGSGSCPMSGAAEPTSSAPSSDANDVHAEHEPAVKK